MVNKQLKIQGTRALLLAAGLGTRLRPFTDSWPKCLMPIQNRPLLEIWLDGLREVGVEHALVNLHSHSGIVQEFLGRPKYQDWVKGVYEAELLGTAGTVRANYEFFGAQTAFMAHADNLCICDLAAFFDYHHNRRPSGTVMTMMTFTTDTPKSCGIVELDSSGRLVQFHEKVENPPSNNANAAIYLIEPEVLEWLHANETITDFSTEVIPKFLGKIATWHNNQIMRDIGTPAALLAAQADVFQGSGPVQDKWEENFRQNPINQVLAHYKESN